MVDFGEKLSMGQAMSLYDMFGCAKTQMLLLGYDSWMLKVFDRLRDDLKVYTNDFSHDYGFKTLKRQNHIQSLSSYEKYMLKKGFR